MRTTLRSFLALAVLLSLLPSPAALAAADGPNDSDPSKKASAEGNPEAAKAESLPLLAREIQQLKDLLEAQAREMEAQRALLLEQQKQLRQQEERTASLEAELQLARGAAAVPSTGEAAVAAPGSAAPGPAAAGTAPGSPAPAAQPAQTLEQKVSNVEGRLKELGPFKFSGDFRLRTESNTQGPPDGSLDRTRERIRLRLNADAKLNDEISGGLTLASGDLNDPISTNQTLGQDFTRKPIAIDLAFITYNPDFFNPLTLTAGKFTQPIYLGGQYRTGDYAASELVWDRDLNPEGAAQTLAFDIDNPVLKRLGFVGFQMPFSENRNNEKTDKSFFNSMVYGGQFQTVWRLGRSITFGAYTGFYNWHDADGVAFALLAPTANFSSTDSSSPLEGLLSLKNNNVQNSMAIETTTNKKTGVTTITGAKFASKFALLDTIARAQIDTGNERWPLIFLGDFVQNTRACANVGNIPSGANFNVPCDPHQRRGYWLEARVGRTLKKGDWNLAYSRIFVEREAVLGAFDYSELRQGSNVSEHRVEVLYQLYDNIRLDFIGLFGRPLVTATSVAEPFLRRLQFDIGYRF